MILNTDSNRTELVEGVGIYIHIPFCKQACFYCDFHFSTSLKKKDELIDALIVELELRKSEFENDTVATIYFGGGTPSLLSLEEINQILNAVFLNYKVIENPEITLEANPDDLSETKILELAKSKINRLSIGVQSFFETDLKLMNRAHNATEAKQCLDLATQYFDNISVDLIYGIPGATHEQWQENIQTVLDFNIPHISSYALTVEPKTALESLIKKGKIEDVDEVHAETQFHMLIDELKAANFQHYELSNFGKSGYFSINNSAYWKGKKYIGIGPSAHSFNGESRSWNIANNSKYIMAIQFKELPSEVEILSLNDKYNEYVMTGLRTIWGVSLQTVETVFGSDFKSYILNQSEKYLKEELLYIDGDNLKVSTKGKFLSDGIASHLFKI
ncbi:oxygen-independent coproporphyrinogen III oxidas e [Formosa agariphila KMM 3901]|uniref:Heme chaperone HemW n=1 Tax=Formosa agariphila (strain DSM 15362 / KCTC 12365 / LMG 23005 / KMM 3901 / M-2Alg 35-1) TaxID=1347342 RepID=T2KQS8_FORAG|nr:radical SAM family heme chaperone HemW [Formosa agariphila]CDF80858.1 oxygen-independent coproporphyrinogen III oxidas e [Formosa agariphila KMM 3901]